MPPGQNPSMVASVGSVPKGQVVAEDGAAIGAGVQEGEVQRHRAAAAQVVAPPAAAPTQDPAAFMAAMNAQMMAMQAMKGSKKTPHSV